MAKVTKIVLASGDHFIADLDNGMMRVGSKAAISGPSKSRFGSTMRNLRRSFWICSIRAQMPSFAGGSLRNRGWDSGWNLNPNVIAWTTAFQ